MTQFRVLPVRLGDAYMLKSSRGSYLVDGGGFGCGLPELLHDRRVRKLRAVVCSSPRADKLGGILELMESGMSVTEYWLPDRVESLPEMARRFNGDMIGWQRVAGDGKGAVKLESWPVHLFETYSSERERRLHGAVALLVLAVAVLSTEKSSSEHGFRLPPVLSLESLMGNILSELSARVAFRWRGQQGAVRLALDRMGWQLFAGGGLEEMVFLCGRLLMAEADAMHESACVANTLRGLGLAAMAASLLARLESRFRFFHRTDRVENQLVAYHPLLCLNGVEVDPLEGLEASVTPELLFRDAGRLAGVREGLVFQYGEAECGVMLCGEGKMRFLGRGEMLLLDRPTVVAAPCRGSCVSDRAYDHITSIDPTSDVWVRGFLPSGLKVSPYYTERHETVCLNSCETYAMQEIVLEFVNARWIRRAGWGCLNSF